MAQPSGARCSKITLSMIKCGNVLIIIKEVI